MPVQFLIGQGVHDKGGRLADLHAGKVGFLETTTQKRFGTTVRNGNLSLRLATKLSGEIARRAVGRKSSDRH